MRKLATLVMAASLLCTATPALTDNRYSAHSDAHRTALLELFTSQGCHSCPPAEAWIAKLGKQGYRKDQVIPIALHVDYWDYIGWKDEFANPEHTFRQRSIAAQNRAKTIYTPQLVLNGRDMRPSRKLNSWLPEINEQTARVSIALNATLDGSSLNVQCTLKGNLEPQSQLYLAVTENNLRSEIDSGENAGKTLSHQHVVRDLISRPVGVTTQLETMQLRPEWKKDDLSLVAFVQNAEGDILQALHLPLQ